MPAHVSDQHFNISESVTLGGDPYIKGDTIVWLDIDDSIHKRYIMDKGELVLQQWNGSSWV